MGILADRIMKASKLAKLDEIIEGGEVTVADWSWLYSCLLRIIAVEAGRARAGAVAVAIAVLVRKDLLNER